MTSLLSAYGNFAAVVAVQLLWFVVVSIGRVSIREGIRNLAVGAAAGIPLGLFFDLVIGRYASIFHYADFPTTSSFMLANGILSYGLAIAAVLSFQQDVLPPREGHRKWLALLAASLAFSLALIFPVDRLPTVAGMFLLGALILLFSEALCLVFGQTGYILQAMLGTIGPMVRVWVFSIATGLVYETANYAFALWVWNNHFPSRAINFALIVLLGYFVLLLPIFTFAGTSSASGLNKLPRRE